MALPHLDCNPVVVTAPAFDFEALLKRSVERDQKGHEGLFSLSPMSSPGATPPGFPQCLPEPEIGDFEAALQKRVERDQQRFEGLFSLSPMSSPGATPPSSLQCLPQEDELCPECIESLFSLSPYHSPASTPPNSPRPTNQPLPFPAPPPPGHSSPPKRGTHQVDPSLPSKARRKALAKAASKSSRRNKRQRTQAETFGINEARDAVRKKYVTDKNAAKTTMDLGTSEHVTSTGFVGLNNGSRAYKTYGLEEMIGPASRFKFDLKHWDGHTPMPLLDSKQRLIGIFAGHPNVSNWPMLHIQAAQALEKQRILSGVPRKRRIHRRGAFIALQCGVDHGHGQKHPMDIKNNSATARVLDTLNNMEPFKRISGFASSVLATWAPRLYRYHAKWLTRLYKKTPALTRIFPSSLFTTTTYNLGPQTVCFKHLDFGNLPFSLCAVTALGSYDPTKGGHMILWECRLVVEFPPGSTVLIPSAIISHSNTRIAKHETRYSFTQYCGGALFRWAEHGCMKTVDFYKSLKEEDREKERLRNQYRWKYGLSLLPTFWESPQTSQSV